MTDDNNGDNDDNTDNTDDGDNHLVDAEAVERLKLRFGFDDGQAQLFMMLSGAASLFAEEGEPALGDDEAERHGARALFALALDDAAVAMAAWDVWAEEGLTGQHLQPFIDEIAGSSNTEVSSPGVSWLLARQAMLRLDADESARLLGGARESGHAAVLIDLAALEADGSNPIEARDLLRQAGVETDIDLDAPYDPLTTEAGLGVELAEEIAPFASLRPRPIAGRNDPCPCGSGRKYKQCHLGKELHTLNDRAAWLYLKMMRFMQLIDPLLPDAVVAEMTSSTEAPDLAQLLESSYIPTDIALHEGKVADRFLMAKSSVLPADEVELCERWMATDRTVMQVKTSTHAQLELIDMATRARMTIVGTVPDEPLEVGSLICGRVLPVGDTYRSYGGFLPVDESMVDGILEACASKNLDAVSISLSQIFDAVEMADAVASELADEPGDEFTVEPDDG